MKPYVILVSQILFLATFCYSQKPEPKPDPSEIIRRPSGDTPQSFIVANNGNNTFIKDSLNLIYAVAHGYDDTRLEGVNCTVKPTSHGLTFEVYTPKAGKCTINIYGVNTKTKKEAMLGSYNYNVVDKVYQVIRLDEKTSGEVIYEAPSKITCRNRDYYNWNEEITLEKWKITAGSVTIEGQGESLTKEAKNLIKGLKTGEVIIVETESTSNFQGTLVTKGVFLKG